MPRGRALPRRSATEWGARGVLAVAAVTVGCASVANTFGYMVRNAQPELAHTLASRDGRVTASLARKLSGVEATAADRARADRLARRALRQDPTAVAAVTTLGVNAQLRGDAPTAGRLLAYAKLLSRRDLQTQIWAIEDGVARGDVSGALRHYDIALRTSREAPDLLFPILGSAITDPAIRTGLTRTLTGKPVWGGIFIDYVSGNGPDARATASFFGDLRRANVPISESANATMVSTLAAQASIDAAWAYYASVQRGAERNMSRDPDFTAHPGVPSLFDWTPFNDAGVTTLIQRDGGGLFDFSASATVGGPLLQQTQVLPPGDYILEGRGIGIDQPEGSRPHWNLTCRDGRELGRVVMPNSAQANGVFTGRFSVPAGCSVQTLTLVARPSDAVSGIAGQIDRVRLHPAR